MADKETLENIGMRIADRRRELKMPQEKLAEKVNLSIQTISNIENGKKAVRPENLIKICRALDTTTDYVLLGSMEYSKASELTRKCMSLKKQDYDVITTVIDKFLECDNK